MLVITIIFTASFGWVYKTRYQIVCLIGFITASLVSGLLLIILLMGLSFDDYSDNHAIVVGAILGVPGFTVFLSIYYILSPCYNYEFEDSILLPQQNRKNTLR